MMIKYNTIGSKLIFAFSGLTLLMLIISLVAWFTWAELDQHVGGMLDKTVPKYNTSYVLESRSEHIRQLLDQLSQAQTKSRLQVLNKQLIQEITSIQQLLQQTDDKQQSRLLNLYQKLQDNLTTFFLRLNERLNQQDEIKVLEERLLWIHQDIRGELQPLQQELQWELKNVNGTALSNQLLSQLETIQKLIDNEGDLYRLIQDVSHSNDLRQRTLDDGIKVIHFRAQDLVDLSQPILRLPSAISYQQLTDELKTLVEPKGKLHQSVSDYMESRRKVIAVRLEISKKIETIHSDNAAMVKQADQDFRQVRGQIASIVSYGNRVLLLCFSLGILISLIVIFYFIHRRIVMIDITDQAKANEQLELRVAEKTHSLLESNRKLMAEVEERIRAEQHLKLIQKDLLQAAKMAVVGQTMTSLAHELNQPLSAMTGYVYTAKLLIAQAPLEYSTASLKQIDHIEALTNRMGRIIKSLRDFAKKRTTEPQLKAVNLAQIVEQAFTLLSHKAHKHQITLHHSLPDDMHILGDGIGAEQVLVNLIANSFDALSPLSQQKKIDINILSANSQDIIVAITDTGQGFAHDVVGQLCTPFTTTKEIGLGLGLNISRSLMEQMQGHLLLASNLQGGAMVVLAFSAFIPMQNLLPREIPHA